MRFLLLLSLSLLAFGCSKKGKPCPEDGNCGDGLRCDFFTKTCQSVCGKPSDCGKGLTCDEKDSVCFSEFDRAKANVCEKDPVCEIAGLCKYVDGTCRATEDEHCTKSDMCKDSGLCSKVDRQCKATKDKDCEKTETCKLLGWCSAVDGKCVKK